MSSQEIQQIRKIFENLEGKFEIVLYGSVVTESSRPTSDIDISVITREKDKENNKKIQIELFGVAPLKYDVRVFELLPIYIQM